MMLSDLGLKDAIARGDLSITPWDPTRIQPASIDLALAAGFARRQRGGRTGPDVVNPIKRDRDLHQIWTATADRPFPLQPHEFVLASTIEAVSLSASIAGQIAGKSTLARAGLVVESAGFVDPGFTGQLTLELANLTEDIIELTPGMAIAQLVVFRLDQPAEHPYGSEKLASKYQGQRGPTPHRVNA